MDKKFLCKYGDLVLFFYFSGDQKNNRASSLLQGIFTNQSDRYIACIVLFNDCFNAKTFDKYFFLCLINSFMKNVQKIKKGERLR